MTSEIGQQVILSAQKLNVYYGEFNAVKDVDIDINQNSITALIGPSGCGKSTFLRCLNRMNDLIVGASVQGKVMFEGVDLYGGEIDATEIRSRIGMVFQKPNPFPKSIYQNIAWGLKVNGFKGNYDEAVERALNQAALWDEVKDRLNNSAFTLSGGQQQRLCIARALAVEPAVLLMDEPASALDPIATLAIEELIKQLKDHVTIVIVTHNMQQAARVSDETAFFMVGENRSGYLVEHDDTQKIFSNPSNTRTEEYITGRFS
ncbi:MAG: phosphate ABC transporter ATP-binding protein [Chloroflexi bacterium]|nr:MAG: phosphate ABC transporter ATP-binding protein [SAR202 cluster bacterium]MAO74766.1 phosphate ABC transporter ATP-binding protein [Chloroflexota bacterium]MBA13788.1 phosphate ABC transporter ATP-binding protein [Chloroflexota bacterium]MBG55045.1 phosphate ABC transporter ATP-binding protein [Chloroflexota bacterium]|tara:strand:- start:1550 stop:2332 length:783 start_codon:yes stop_codon:yes gene_type:complete